MVLTDADLGRNLKNARELRGVTQEELARRTAKPRSAISKMESGNQKISTVDLAEFAQALGMRISWLLEQPPASIVSHRSGDAERAGLIDSEIEGIAREVELLASMNRRLTQRLERLPDPLARPHNGAEVEDAAIRARCLMGLDTDGPLHDLAQRMEAVGVLAFSVELGENEADGATVLLTSGAVSVINASRRVGRRRLTAAHELGHALFADAYSVDYPIGDEAECSEQLMDAFARALLLPARSVE